MPDPTAEDRAWELLLLLILLAVLCLGAGLLLYVTYPPVP